MVEMIIDTNTILRFVLKDVSSQNVEVYELIKKAKDKKIKLIIPEIVVFETYFTLKSYYEYKKETLLIVLESLLSADYFKVENSHLFMEAVKILGNSNLEFVDCFLAAKSKFLETKLFTFDNNLNKYLYKK
ncbi:MAG: PIN domain-containing protein [bacterium]|nr:MAG: PIN domain-containing protein [bacterium]